MKAPNATPSRRGTMHRAPTQRKRLGQHLWITIELNQIIDKHQAEPSSLIQVMLEIQSENNWLPKTTLDRVSERLDVPLARILLYRNLL